MSNQTVTTRYHGKPDTKKDADWRQYRGNGQRSCLAWWNNNLPQGRILWTLSLNPLVDASPVVGPDGVIYVGSATEIHNGIGDPVPSRGLVAINPDGTKRWELHLNVGHSGYEVRATPAVRNDGRIVVVGDRFHSEYTNNTWEGKGRLFLVNPSGVIEKWLDEYEGPGTSSPLLDSEDNTYFWSLPPSQPTPYCVWKIDREFTGSTCIGGITPGWESVPFDWSDLSPFTSFDPSGIPIHSCAPLLPSPSLGGYGDVIGTANRTIRCKTSSRNLWEKDLVGLETPVVGTGGRAYIVTDKRLEAWDLDGSKRWKVDLGGLANSAPALGAAEGEVDQKYIPKLNYPDGTRPPVVTVDHRFGRDIKTPFDIYIPNRGELWAIDYKGQVRWKQGLGANASGGPICIQHLKTHEQRIIIGCDDCSILAFNREGNRLWQIQLDSPIYGIPAATNGCLYVATRNSVYSIG